MRVDGSYLVFNALISFTLLMAGIAFDTMFAVLGILVCITSIGIAVYCKNESNTLEDKTVASFADDGSAILRRN